MPAAPDRAPSGDPDSLVTLLGGRTGALDASLPGLVLVAVVVWRDDLGLALGVAVAVAVLLGALRLLRGRPPRAALLGLLGTVVSALVVARTGRAVDFFLLQLLANGASALVWTLSVWLRRPLLGLVVGGVLRQRGAWRRDPVLLRAYSRASWWWVGSYVLRFAVFATLWWADQLLALGVARAALSWPLVTAVVALSWWTVRRMLPAGHPGLRHPQVPDGDPAPRGARRPRRPRSDAVHRPAAPDPAAPPAAAAPAPSPSPAGRG
ncbi:DUF3159 domain-containing protein [Aquipuribacter sp. SD81]|uniref:DUF3159 domain-containing protein n=1 Tax=Aquipuribacter sp. SD81 TaxID=3127703 RepID=UPI00301917B7